MSRAETVIFRGRVWVQDPADPRATNSGYVPRARFIMEQHLGRKLARHELVHHKNENKLDDRLENLEVKTRGGHTKDHWTDGTYDSSRKLDYDVIRSLRAQGMGYKKIARTLGVPRSSVQHACSVIEQST